MAEYDGLAHAYHDSKLLAFRSLEQATFLHAVGDVTGQAVLDLACGSGYYTRLMKKAGADSAVGVDISADMIALARREETQMPHGITYVHGDARDADVAALGGPFDVVTCTYLFNYARSPHELAQMLAAARRAVRPGGRVVGLNDNPAQAPADFGGTRAYGFVKTRVLPDEPRADGDVVRYEFAFESPTSPGHKHAFAFENVWFAPATYDALARAAGFASPVWIPVSAAVAPSGAADWTAWAALAQPPIACIVLTPL